MVKFLTPQEVEVYYIIPGLKSCISRCLKEKGYSQSEIARMLQVDRAAVSQYVSGKRGQTKFDKETSDEIKKSVLMIHDVDSMTREIQRLIVVTRRNKTLCRVHKEINGEMPCSPELIRLCTTGSY